MKCLLIKGMEMPQGPDNSMIVIAQDGSVWKKLSINGWFQTGYKAIELPEHGDLISKKALEVQIAHAFHGDMFPDISAGLALNKVMNIITDAPVIVEATE